MKLTKFVPCRRSCAIQALLSFLAVTGSFRTLASRGCDGVRYVRIERLTAVPRCGDRRLLNVDRCPC